MFHITLPDGTQRAYDAPVSVAQVAQSIGAGLARAALAGRVNDKLVDLSFVVDTDCQLSIITAKDAEGLEVLRHSCAHLLAQAVQALYPTAQVTIGPVIEDGFYYDFAYDKPFTPEDLVRIEAQMHVIAALNLAVHRQLMSREDAIALFEKKGEGYKVEIISAIPAGDPLSFYQQGDFIDLCRGPHVPSTAHLKVFKLLKVAGAYWRGDSKNAVLQRIYGTAWADEKSLAAYLTRIEEAERRDHRRIGKSLELFHFQNEAPGMVFWHPRGWTVYQIMQGYIRSVMQKNRYLEVNTPQVVDISLWEKSGHAEKFKQNMYTLHIDEREYALKPMNCPCHIQIFNQGLKSYRDLPMRLAEFGSCHRQEASGALHGLMRVRHFVQDDGHIFCTEDQIAAEVSAFIALVYTVYADFGFTDILVRLSTRPVARVGTDEVWDKAEAALSSVLDSRGVTWQLAPGEGAFYGPKVEFTLKDCLGRLWQCGTIQVDFSMPHRLGATYIAEDGSRQVPVMLHRAVLGTFERFIGILIEETAGILPSWLAPIQAVVLNITDKQSVYAQEVAEKLINRGFRVITDLRNEKIGFKIREYTLQKVPYLLVVGDREVETQQVSVRNRAGEDLGAEAIMAFGDRLAAEVQNKGLV